MTLDARIFDFNEPRVEDKISSQIVQQILDGNVTVRPAHVGRVVNLPRLDGPSMRLGRGCLSLVADYAVERTRKIADTTVRVDYVFGQEDVQHIPELSDPDILVDIVQEDLENGDTSIGEIYIRRAKSEEVPAQAALPIHEAPEREDLKRLYRFTLGGISPTDVLSEISLQRIEQIDWALFDKNRQRGIRAVYRNNLGSPWLMLQTDYATNWSVAQRGHTDRLFDAAIALVGSIVSEANIWYSKDSGVSGQGSKVHTTREYFLRMPLGVAQINAFSDERVYPKGIDLSGVTYEELEQMQHLLNGAEIRPYDAPLTENSARHVSFQQVPRETRDVTFLGYK